MTDFLVRTGARAGAHALEPIRVMVVPADVHFATGQSHFLEQSFGLSLDRPAIGICSYPAALADKDAAKHAGKSGVGRHGMINILHLAQVINVMQ